VGVEIEEPDALIGGDVARDRADPDGTVATEHERDLPLADRVADPARGVLHDLDHLGEVLRAAVIAIRSPAPRLAVPVVVDVDA
jgi:hypothetical protein